MKKIILLTIVVLILTTGCSSGSNNGPTMVDEPVKAAADKASHQFWGMWQCVADPDKGSLEMVQLRGIDMHLNALQFLEPPPMLNLTLETLEFNGNIIEADIGLRHPFLALTEFTGFDVAGILISNGSVSGFDDPALVMAGDGDTRLLNPDGYARWWNPAEFPVNDGTMFSYKDGLLGAPDSIADFNCTLNGYKYFCDDLGPNDPLSMITPESRGLFSAGQKNVRHYTIELGSEGLIFNYAVDASWQFPVGSPPFTAPDDFPPGANRPEAYRITTTVIENTLWADGGLSGGDLSLQIDVYDWHNADMNSVKVEAGNNFPPVTSSIATGSDANFSTYQIDIVDATPVTAGLIDLMITVESDETGYGGAIPGAAVSSYFFFPVLVDNEAPQEPPTDQGWLQGYFNSEGHCWNPSSTIELPLTEVFSTTRTRSGYRPPVVKGDQLWLTAAEGYIQSYSSLDGSFIWEQDIKTAGSFWAGFNPLVYGDKVISGGNGIFLFDAADGAGPDWTFMSGSDFLHMGGVFVGDTLYWRSCHNRFYSVDLTTGTENWNASGSTFPLFNPSADENYVIYPSGNSLQCYQTDGTYNWTKNVGGNFYGAPLMYEGKAYFGYNGLMCVDVATGTTEWTAPFDSGYTFTRSLVLAGVDRITAMTRSSSSSMKIYCFDLSGNQQWVLDLGLCMANACYSNGYIFTVARVNASDSFMQLIAVDIDDGTIVESVGSFSTFWGGVTCTNNRLYFGDNYSGLYCYE